MSALGQKRTFKSSNAISALPPKADIPQHRLDVRFVQKADIGVVNSLNEKPGRHAGVFYLRG
jgi:hypothetical protein